MTPFPRFSCSASTPLYNSVNLYKLIYLPFCIYINSRYTFPLTCLSVVLRLFCARYIALSLLFSTASCCFSPFYFSVCFSAAVAVAPLLLLLPPTDVHSLREERRSKCCSLQLFVGAAACVSALDLCELSVALRAMGCTYTPK